MDKEKKKEEEKKMEQKKRKEKKGERKKKEQEVCRDLFTSSSCHPSSFNFLFSFVFCTTMGSDGSRFSVSFFVTGKASRVCLKTTAFEAKGELKPGTELSMSSGSRLTRLDVKSRVFIFLPVEM